MKHASLFTGIGGFDLAAQWMGWENVFQVEKDKFCQDRLKEDFPNTKKHGDIKEFDGTQYRGTIDIISGGFPCQPFSINGKRKGTNDNRHLWPEMLRVIREIQPVWVVGENVPNIINMELENVCLDLESIGYKVQPFVIPARSINAVHNRYRVWVVAYSPSIKQKRGIYKRSEHKGEVGRILTPEGVRDAVHRYWENSLPKSRTVGGNDGLSCWVDRAKRTEALGNAVVPQLVYEIFRIIEQYNNEF